MSKTIRSAYVSVAICLLSVSVAFGAYHVGERVNEFTLPDAYGTSVSYSQFAGMVVVINFWQST